MTDIVERLHDAAEYAPSEWAQNLFKTAGDEIERLRALAFTAYSEGFTHGTCKMPFSSSWETSSTKKDASR